MKYPSKAIKDTVSELEKAIFEGEDSEFSSLRVSDAHHLLVMMHALSEKDSWCLDLYTGTPDVHLLEFLPESICKYMNDWIEKVLKEILAERNKNDGE